MFPRLSLRIPRLGRLERIFLVLLGLDVAAWLAQSLARWTPPGRDLLHLALYIAGFLVLLKLLRTATHRLLWRVRNRMIVLFLFIGVVPLVLVTTLVGLAGYVLGGQVAVYMATSELDRRATRLQETAASLVWSLRHAGPARRRAEWTNSFLEHAAASWPGLEAMVRESGETIVFPAEATLNPSPASAQWTRGIVNREGNFYLMARATAEAPVAGAESVTAPRPSPKAEDPAVPAASAGPEVILLQPLGESYLAGLAPGLGRIVFLPGSRAGQAPAGAGSPGAGPSATASPGGETLGVRSGARRAFSEQPAPVPPPVNRFDRDVFWGTSFSVDGWAGRDQDLYVNLLIHTRFSAIYRLLFGQRMEVASTVTAVFLVVGPLFLIVELLSVLTGVSITRTLTNSVHQIYEGTQSVNRGDFSHRILVGGHDQLAELSRSFNSMTASIERLIEESKERQKLASELQIAREVQEQLFPKAPPALRNLAVVGVCNAARIVSGDYFDFIRLSEDRLALAIGDVAGKGIQGALLMASIQSMLRSQLWGAGTEVETDGGLWRFPTAGLVSRLNLQLYQNTAPEKFATFFFGAYDDSRGLLTYTNAGHLPPVLIRNGEPSRLDVNGMVVGAFSFAEYDQSEIELHAGDLIVAFTDGVTEPENEFAEEFGEDRLIELLVRHWRREPREIIDATIAAVNQWTGRPELQDDMTMVVARRL